MPLPNALLSTYRLQFNKDFRFSDATRLLDYFSHLGITDLYASPILVSRKGSGHGYDVTDPTRIDPEIGSEEDFEVLQNELAQRGMGLLLDIVPNHMAASSENPWWMDVLENGPYSAFASYFDIDWRSPSRNLAGKVFLPVLGRPFGEVLDAGELQLIAENRKFLVRYFDEVFPIAPQSYHQVLNLHQEDLERKLGKDSPPFQEFLGVLAGLTTLAKKVSTARAGEVRLEFDAILDRLQALSSGSPKVCAFVESNLNEFNGKPGCPASFNLLERLLSEQYYLLAYWLDPNEAINYRRFFAISDLVGVRVEDPLVFEAGHGQIFRLRSNGAKRGVRIGLRVDHIDGLRDPSGYLVRLQQRIGETESENSPRPCVIVEKILAHREELPEEWPVCGTTGYEYLNHLNGPFVHPEGCKRLEEIYSDFIGKHREYQEIVYEKKKLIMSSTLCIEIRGLARLLAALAAKDRYARSIPYAELNEALVEVTACMPVYRTYVRSFEVPASAANVINSALTCASSKRPELSRACLNFVRDVLTLANPPHVSAEQREERLNFVMRWQQFTGPIVAKGLEDTALYVYYPLSSLNEVGGDPEPSRVVSREEFYEFLSDRQRRWPRGLSATTTHDTKRSEDVRARLNVLSEIPDEWGAKLAMWTKLNAGHKQMVDGLCVPDANEEYLTYETLLGIWPSNPDDLAATTKRLQEYMVKALREATIHTRWIKPNEVHERAVTQFIGRVLAAETGGPFLRDISEFQRRIACCGMINGLAQLLLKIISPGIPDFYQGSELWDLRLVDPDNRRPVDFARRCKSLSAVSDDTSNPELVARLLQSWTDGRVKMFVIRKALRCRLEHPELFTEGDVLPVAATGPRSQHVVSILRRNEGGEAIAVVPRWLATAEPHEMSLPSPDFWGDTALRLPKPASEFWKNALTGERIAAPTLGGHRSITVASAFKTFPVALLIAED
jgi:(1->4)-alpha-D-glucan 1-alpha-D-glucosylmutase